MSHPAQAKTDAARHSLLEDIYALMTGSLLMAVGLVLMKAGGIVTAGVAGLALLASYKLALPIGLLFFLLNVPFLFLGLGILGWTFLVRTMAVSLLILLFSWLTQLATTITWVHPAFAAVAGGTACGIGIMVVLRHNTGVGGVNILALALEKKTGWRLGWLQLALDLAILLAAGFVLDAARMAWSILSVLAANLVLIVYHKPGRYAGH